MLMCKSSRQFCMTAVIGAWADMFNNVCTITVFFKWVLLDINRREHHILKVPCWIWNWYILRVWCRCSFALVRSKAGIYGISYIRGCVCAGLWCISHLVIQQYFSTHWQMTLVRLLEKFYPSTHPLCINKIQQIVAIMHKMNSDIPALWLLLLLVSVWFQI